MAWYSRVNWKKLERKPFRKKSESSSYSFICRSSRHSCGFYVV